MNSHSFDDFGRYREIPVAGVSGGTHISLINLLARDFAHGHYISRARRHGDKWLEAGKIDLLTHIITASGSATSSTQSASRPCDFRKRRTSASEGKTVEVAPSSAPMLAITWRSIDESPASPGP